AAWFGLVFAVAGFALTIWVIFDRLTDARVPQGWASTTAVILVVGGVQLVMLGVIGEYLSRVYDEVGQRPPYIIRSRVGFSEKMLRRKSKSCDGYPAMISRSPAGGARQARYKTRRFGRQAPPRPPRFG